MDLPEMQDFLTNQGVVRGIRVSDTNAYDLAKAFGGTTLLDEEIHIGEHPPTILGIRLPTLYGNIDINTGEYLIREMNTGRLSSMTEKQFKQTYFEEADANAIDAIRGIRQHEETEKRDAARLEAMRNHPSSYPNPVRGHNDLYAERQKRLNGEKQE